MVNDKKDLVRDLENEDKVSNIVIGIEGLVGAGKTSICKELLKFIPNSVVLHAGDVYRAVVFKLLEIKNFYLSNNKKSENKLIEKNFDLSNINIKQLMEKFKINLRIENNETVVYFGDEKVNVNSIQSDEVSLAVSKVANIADNKDAYKVVCDIINNLREKYNVIFYGNLQHNNHPLRVSSDMFQASFYSADGGNTDRILSFMKILGLNMNVNKYDIDRYDKDMLDFIDTMPVYPHNNSIQLYGNTVIIKLR